ncbi:hypothetical protein [Pseudanabaena minima]
MDLDRRLHPALPNQYPATIQPKQLLEPAAASANFLDVWEVRVFHQA